MPHVTGESKTVFDFRFHAMDSRFRELYFRYFVDSNLCMISDCLNCSPDPKLRIPISHAKISQQYLWTARPWVSMSLQTDLKLVWTHSQRLKAIKYSYFPRIKWENEFFFSSVLWVKVGRCLRRNYEILCYFLFLVRCFFVEHSLIEHFCDVKLTT